QHRYNPDKSALRTWLIRISCRVNIDDQRRRKVQHLGGLTPLDHRDDQDRIITRIDSRERVRHLISKVGEKHWDVIKPSLEGASDKSAAEELGLKVKTLKTKKTRAFKAFREA